MLSPGSEGIVCTGSSSVPRSGALRVFHKRERDTEQGKPCAV